MWRALFVAFLLVHAGIHVAMWASPEPKDPKASLDAGHSWLLGDQRALALSLALVAADSWRRPGSGCGLTPTGGGLSPWSAWRCRSG
jgi:hypothetical protein